ncbi:MAG: hypothetical protein H8E14_01305 [Candidatus Marinimicrobia bacterium]|nr:hypothetical protein [Candidatus Neomarinimicrobiota bacterium]
MKERLPESELADYEKFMVEYFDMTGIISKTEQELQDLNNRFGYYWLQVMGNCENTPVSHHGDPSMAGGFMPYGIYFSFGKSWDFTKNMSKISVPTLIIHGEQDLQPRAIAELYNDLLPNSRLITFENASHFPFIETPELFVSKLSEFLNNNLKEYE